MPISHVFNKMSWFTFLNDNIVNHKISLEKVVGAIGAINASKIKNQFLKRRFLKTN